ncbi:glycosyltransferase family 2 protein [Oleisolibacter albus]|uniref:glycosyltransferase family 2 protein n=1 Tax=Oleisolibacter albus TaxID=2171757 RepID=UPI000DF20A26|nr:glycosyltransferase family 2 protein [Oleisolibacter albus]
MLTVIFSSHNGARTLPRVLEAYTRLIAPRGGWRLIAVDNGSSDDTPAILSSFVGRLPLTLLREAGKGKNRALNRALPQAEGDLFVFTDDDAVPEPDWLLRLRAAADAHREHDIFGGAIRPFWPHDPPDWMARFKLPLNVLYAVTQEQEGPCAASLVWGPNMAIRAAVFRQGHRFDDTVGPDGTPAYAMGSETEFNTRLERAGHRAWFVADALVHHMIRPEQMDEGWILGRAYRHGRGIRRFDPDRGGGGPMIGALPLAVAARLAFYRAAAPLVRPLPPSRKRFWMLWREQWYRGLADSYRMGPPPRLGTPQPTRAA